MTYTLCSSIAENVGQNIYTNKNILCLFTDSGNRMQSKNAFPSARPWLLLVGVRICQLTLEINWIIEKI